MLKANNLALSIALVCSIRPAVGFAESIPALPALDVEQTSAVPADSRTVTILAHIASVEKLLPRLPDRGAALYYLAALNLQLGEMSRAEDLLRQCLKLREGFDPSGSTVFEELLRNSRDFDRLIARAHRDFPAVSRARRAYKTTEADLVPEGLAYNARKNAFYLGSLNRRKIVNISASGVVSDFVPAERDNLLPVLGIRVHSDSSVWANSWSESAARSELLHFDSSGVLLGRYSMKDAQKHGFNDLVIAEDGQVILTDSLSDQVFKFDPAADSFTPLAVHRPLAEPNGIALADGGRVIFVADDLGVVRIDLRSGASADVDPGAHATLAGADGLYWYKGGLIAIQNGIGSPRIAAFKLTDDGARVTSVMVLENRSAYTHAEPTTGAIAGNLFYFIVNSQVANMDGDRVTDASKLAPVLIGVLQLP